MNRLPYPHLHLLYSPDPGSNWWVLRAILYRPYFSRELYTPPGPDGTGVVHVPLRNWLVVPV